MTPIATSIEQGERLLKAGVPNESADMYWCCEAFEPEDQYAVWECHTISPWMNEALIDHHAWSLSALWQMAYELDKTYEFPTELSAEELIETLVKTLEYRFTHA